MKPINVLPPSIYNLLSAGEVVEGPASVVKEAAENALDAGATSIEIAIERGGLDLIRITDNGHGVPPVDVEKVFLPHATSKITTARDLEKIGSLGFRGEAMSSVAAVSKTEFITRTSEDSIATKLLLEAGNIALRTKIAAAVGTTLTVKNLFYNTPARRKFLASPNTEKNHVTFAVQKIILSNPRLAVKYLIDDEVVYDYRGKNLRDAVAAVFGKETAEHIIEVKTRYDLLALSGFISTPDFTKKNRTYQHTSVNGRPVDGGIIASAVNEVFSNYLMAGNFPFFVLDLTVDLHEVDVNVHPRKSEVKFSVEPVIYSFVKDAITETLDAYFAEQRRGRMPEQIKKDENDLAQKIKFFSSTKNSETAVRSAPNLMSKFDMMEQEKIAKTKSHIKDAVNTRKQVEQIKILPSFDFRVIGTIFDTYILLDCGERFLIVDQHAGHERLLYDELKKQIDAGCIATQKLLEPLVIALNPKEMNQMISAMPLLGKMGIESEPFGTSCFRITAVPLSVSVRGIDTVINNILHEVKGSPPTELSELLKDKIISECCKAAIKAGECLNNAQVNAFLTQFDKNMVPLCPHGRPIVIAFTKAQIEKMFARR